MNYSILKANVKYFVDRTERNLKTNSIAEDTRLYCLEKKSCAYLKHLLHTNSKRKSKKHIHFNFQGNVSKTQDSHCMVQQKNNHRKKKKHF